jgi:hypothetical protein
MVIDWERLKQAHRFYGDIALGAGDGTRTAMCCASVTIGRSAIPGCPRRRQRLRRVNLKGVFRFEQANRLL